MELHNINEKPTLEGGEFSPNWTAKSPQQEAANENPHVQGKSHFIHALLHIKGTICETIVCVLHDDGSSQKSILEKLVRKLQLKTSPSTYKVKSSFQGTSYNGTCENKGLGNYKEKRDFLILALQLSDVILDMPFQHQHNPCI